MPFAGTKPRVRRYCRNKGDFKMLQWALIFLVVAIVAAVLGFGGIAGTASWIAQVLFVVFLILAVIAYVRRNVYNSQTCTRCPGFDL